MINHTTRRAAAWSAFGLLAASLSAVALLSPGPVRADSVAVAVENYDFAPASRTITAGDVVRWTFSGDQHSVTSRDGLFDSGIKDAGGSFQFTFTKAGTYHYYCVVHPGLMSGTIVVKAPAATPGPTVKPTPTPTPTPRPTPKPTARATVKPSPSATPTPAPPTADPSPSTPPPAAASAVPTASAGASQAVATTPGSPSATAPPVPAPTEPANTDGATPIVAVGALLATVALVGGLLLARRRRPG